MKQLTGTQTAAVMGATAVFVGAFVGPAALDVLHGTSAPELPAAVAEPVGNLSIPPMPTTTTEDAETDPYRIAPGAGSAAAANPGSSPTVTTGTTSGTTGTTSGPATSPTVGGGIPTGGIVQSGPAPPTQTVNGSPTPISTSPVGTSPVGTVSQPAPTTTVPPTTTTTRPPTTTTTVPTSGPGSCTLFLATVNGLNPGQANISITTAPVLAGTSFAFTISSVNPDGSSAVATFDGHKTDGAGTSQFEVEIPTNVWNDAQQPNAPLIGKADFGGFSCTAEVQRP